MINCKDKKLCCGCSACLNKCPKHCISMKEQDGFLYPTVDETKCVKCGLCKNVCPILKTREKEEKTKFAFACYSKDEEILNKSSSGGVFSLLAEEILNDGGVVFGAGLDENFNVKHMFIEEKNALDNLRTSKYVQSDMGECYKKAKDFLDAGKKVMFSGTPCQISGLKQYLLKNYDNLFLQDVICHGVPSPKDWEDYKDEIKKQFGQELVWVNFRDKQSGWKQYSITMKLNNNKEYSQKYIKDKFLKRFLSNKHLRPSCYDCKFKGYKHDSDITLADYWGIGFVHPVLRKINKNKGMSLVIIQSDKGMKLFEKIKSRLVYKKTNMKLAVIFNPSYKKSAKPK